MRWHVMPALPHSADPLRFVTSCLQGCWRACATATWRGGHCPRALCWWALLRATAWQACKLHYQAPLPWAQLPWGSLAKPARKCMPNVSLQCPSPHGRCAALQVVTRVLGLGGTHQAPLGKVVTFVGLAAAVLQLVGSKDALLSAAEGPEDHSQRGRQQLSAPPPPPLAVAAPTPPDLQPFARDSPQLRALVASAMQGWGATSSLAHAPVQGRGGSAAAGPAQGSTPSSLSPQGQHTQQQGSSVQQAQGLGIVVSPSIDVGVQQVAPVSPDLLAALAAAAAAAQEAVGAGGSGAAPRSNSANMQWDRTSAPSLLDLLQHLPEPAEPARQQRQSSAGGSSASSTGNGALAANGSTKPAKPPAPLLHFRHIAIANSGDADVWLLGGVASPSLPHTFAVVDDARLFLAEGQWLQCKSFEFNTMRIESFSFFPSCLGPATMEDRFVPEGAIVCHLLHTLGWVFRKRGLDASDCCALPPSRRRTSCPTLQATRRCACRLARPTRSPWPSPLLTVPTVPKRVACCSSCSC